MKIKHEKIVQLIEEIDDIILYLLSKEKSKRELIRLSCSTYRKSARNLIHYKALRQDDIRRIQKKLGNIGLSRLARAEGHVMASLVNTRFILNLLIGGKSEPKFKSRLSIKSGQKLLINHTKELLGYRSKGRRVRIMVTQPTESAYNYQLVLKMIKSGMNCARINCAHDDAVIWGRIIQNIKKASKTLGRNVKITMDLAGPKIRTGEIIPGPRVRKFSPKRDDSGKVTQPSLITMVPEITEESERNTIPVDHKWLQKLQSGDKLTLTDTRGRSIILKVIAVGENEAQVNCYDSCYIGTGIVIHPDRKNLKETKVGEFPPQKQSILLKINDILTIHRNDVLGEPAYFDQDGNLQQEAHISCQLDEVFESVKNGERILFDDGKIEGVIESSEKDLFKVRITRAKENGTRLKAEKGINFPTTNIGVSGLTAKDKEDLIFVAENADVVNFSFVNSVDDVYELLAELEKLGALRKLSIILKIETQRAFDNLPEILLTAMQVRYVGVMIARGDLAVETGWQAIGWVQKEILAMCSAAHIPVIWATQVLENLAKKGLPSRSEITDAASSLKSECVMLNKGAYINEAIMLLDKILSDMEHFQEKSDAMLPQMEKLLV